MINCREVSLDSDLKQRSSLGEFSEELQKSTAIAFNTVIFIDVSIADISKEQFVCWISWSHTVQNIQELLQGSGWIPILSSRFKKFWVEIEEWINLKNWTIRGLGIKSHIMINLGFLNKIK